MLLDMADRANGAAYVEATRQPFDAVVRELRELLTPRLVAFIADVRETRAVHQWADGTREVKSDYVERRLRLTLRVALLLREREEPRVIQAWFQSLNPDLDDRSAARLLRDGDLDEVGPRVLAAARSFVATGGA
jgi:hypothetical protein